MTKAESIEEIFQKEVCSIRSSSDYPASIYSVKKKLDLSNNTTDFEIEALLIHATRERFGESLDADMVLMALGLLDEFDNPRDSLENRSGLELVTERRKMFIKMSSYVADRHNHSNKRRVRHYESYEELEAAGEDAMAAVINALGSEDATRIKKVAKKIYAKRFSIVDYLKEANKYLIHDKKGNIIDVKLQELKNIRQEPISDITKDEMKKADEQGLKTDSIQDNFPSATEQKSLCPAAAEDALSESNSSAEKIEVFGKIEEQVEKEAKVSDEGHEGKLIKLNSPEPLVPKTDIPPDIPPKPSKTTVWLKVSTVMLIASIFALALIGIGNIVITQRAISLAFEESKAVQKPYSIKFRNPDEWLPFEKNYYLTVDPRPDDASLEGLRCESKNPDIVEILSESELHIKTAEESEDSKECNVRIKAYMSYDSNIKDEMTVHVIKNGENEPMGVGELDDKSSGNSNQKID